MKDKEVATLREMSLDHRKAAADRRSYLFNRLHWTEKSGIFEVESRYKRRRWIVIFN